MPRLFLPPEQFRGDTAVIVGPDHLHLARVLRARIGDNLTLFDNQGNGFDAVIVTIGKAETLVRIDSTFTPQTEPSIAITVAQALGKSDKFEQVIQHGTEVGATAFLPIRADRCAVDVPEARLADRVQRWRLIAKSAAEQSGRCRIPTVGMPMTFVQMLASLTTANSLALVLHPESESVPLRTILTARNSPDRLLLAVGPEGGWSPTEVSGAKAANLPCISLGARVLRTETAALVAISQIIYHWDLS